eukprot:TRINITY_DN1377_c1_g1_i2.p1 TRINITY_DN1377_c1_g1~~TRINITY_DN1377_c1_g1_i2.p1  ORF type:complete len:368 (+),score=152.10 TRINITY_DN1377_c1_g1_i2:166-1269(+)
MPPKKAGGPSKKSVDKAKTKIVEDKTFGMKNKNKSKKAQEYIKNVEKQVKGSTAEADKLKYENKMKKKEEEERLKLERDIFKPAVAATKVPVGVNPKSVVCEFFKVGMCTKGDKCKFSHDLAVARKAEKIDIYTDRREDDKMDDWDQDKLAQVVESKEGGSAKQQHRTDIVCKYFIEAIENRKYGWFWECPNGGDKCMYRHALPPGFVLKSKAKEQQVDDEDEETLEDKLEAERAKLTTRTPITKESFLKWKEDKKKEKTEKQKADKDKRDADIKAGRTMRSGREMFDYNPELFQDDIDADVVDIAELPEEQNEGPVITIDVTGTSIKTTVTNQEGEEEEGEENEGKQEIQEDLFVEDDIPDIPDDE